MFEHIFENVGQPKVHDSKRLRNKPLTVFITVEGRTLEFGIGELPPELITLGMDVPPQIIANRTMVPLRFVSEFFGAAVHWDADARSIEIIWDSAIPNTQSPIPVNGTITQAIPALIREDEEVLEVTEAPTRE